MYLSDDFGQKSSILKTDVEISLLLSIVSIPVQNDTILSKKDTLTCTHLSNITLLLRSLRARKFWSS